MARRRDFQRTLIGAPLLALLLGWFAVLPAQAKSGATKPQAFREGVRYFDLGHYAKTRALMLEAQEEDPSNDGNEVLYGDNLHQTAYVPSYFEGAAVFLLAPKGQRVAACDEAESLLAIVDRDVLEGAPEKTKREILESMDSLTGECDLARADAMRASKRIESEATGDAIAGRSQEEGAAAAEVAETEPRQSEDRAGGYSHPVAER